MLATRLASFVMTLAAVGAFLAPSSALAPPANTPVARADTPDRQVWVRGCVHDNMWGHCETLHLNPNECARFGSDLRNEMSSIEVATGYHCYLFNYHYGDCNQANATPGTVVLVHQGITSALWPLHFNDVVDYIKCVKNEGNDN
ncbi:hypothetical protein C8F04DRAFT_1186695 [Mycena alexandri]|uniref:Uncharacterized protein n=1 Tax=Mycena alexandri TaxID=1745969 RepID=A0AAD6SNJ2_9AGAR|nr:hypothetical protein C8F04DRAFT_1186695 [Mycena alexandri]